MVRLTDRPDMTLDVYRGRKTTMQQHVHAKHYKHNADGRTAPGVCGNGSIPLSHSGNVVMRIGIHTHTLKGMVSSTCVFNYSRLSLSRT